MFTGLVRRLGIVSQARPTASGRALVITVPTLAGEVATGDSVAVNGVCLTVTQTLRDGFEAFAGTETCQRTTLGRLPAGTQVNLEPALKVGQAMGGHIVQGHVDGMGSLTAAGPEGETVRMAFAAGAELLTDMVPRGSVAVDGVSLTLTAVTDSGFEVAIIPHTWEHTNLRHLTPGAMVNIETDIVAKYVRRFLAAQAGPQGLTREFLAEHGYL